MIALMDLGPAVTNIHQEILGRFRMEQVRYRVEVGHLEANYRMEVRLLEEARVVGLEQATQEPKQVRLEEARQVRPEEDPAVGS